MAHREKRPRALGTIENNILYRLSAGDLFVGFVLSACSTKLLYSIAHKRYAARQNARRAIHGLSEKGMVTIDRDDKLRITPKGRKALDRSVIRLRSTIGQRRPRWDKKWRMVVFDVPETVRGARDALRATLKRAGFKQLQQSVWVHPFECTELTKLVREDKRLTHTVVLATVEHIDSEKQLRRWFRL